MQHDANQEQNLPAQLSDESPWLLAEHWDDATDLQCLSWSMQSLQCDYPCTACVAGAGDSVGGLQSADALRLKTQACGIEGVPHITTAITQA